MCPYDPDTSLSGFSRFAVPGFAATLMQEEGGTPILSVFGEIDLYTVHDVDLLMLAAVAEAGEGGSVIVDLSGVDFMDLSGLKVLIAGRGILEDSPGGTLVVVCRGQVRRLFEITAGLMKSFELYPDPGSAVAGHPMVSQAQTHRSA